MQKQVSFGDAVKMYFTRWTFAGRSSRSEYWWPQLLMFLLSFIPVVGRIAGLVNIGPGICCFVRRLHDIGKSGWWFWLGLIPLAGPIVLLIFAVQPSQTEENAYGPVPNVA